MGFGFTEGLIILAVIILMFGGKKLPELGSSLGKAITNFKKGMNEDENKDQDKIEKDS